MPEVTINHPAQSENTIQGSSKGIKNVLAAGSLIGAVLASSCCIGPLLLLSLGISGAWISNLTALASYQPLILTVTFLFLGAGFWKTYQKPKIICEDGSYCASSISDRVSKIALWLAVLLVIAALAVNFLVPVFL